MTSSRHRHRAEARNRAEICQNSLSPQVNNSALKTQPRSRPNTESAWPDTPAMAHRRARRVLEQRRLFCLEVGNLRLIGLLGLGPASIFTCSLDRLLTASTSYTKMPHMTLCSNSNQKDLLRSLMAKNIALAASSAGIIRQPYDGDSYLNVTKELRSHFSISGILINIDIVDVLRRWHSNHTVTQTSKSTGILKMAKADYAHATLNTDINFYASRTFISITDDAKDTGRLKDKVEFGRYKYSWKDQDFQVYVADY